MSVPATILIQTIDTTWRPLDSSLGGTVIPESIQFESLERGGASTASFSIKRNTTAPWSDLAPFTPVVIQLGGSNVWRGRIMRTPKSVSESHVWNVECEGIYQHLADDVADTGYVHAGWGGWVDVRERHTDNLFDGAYDVVVGEFGYTWVRMPVGNSAASGRSGGVIFDAGPNGGIERMVLTYIGGGGTNMALVGRSGNTVGGTDESFTIDATPIATGSTTYSRTFTAPRRYVRIFAQASGGTLTGATDTWVRLDQILLFTDANYESGNASILVQSDIVKNELAASAPLISADDSLIDTTSTVIPHFWPDGFQTIQERLDSVRLFDTEQFRLSNDFDPKAILTAPVSTPEWVYDSATDGGSFDNASANDGQEIYNVALPVFDAEISGRIATRYRSVANTQAFTNPDFEGGTTNWTAGTNTTIAASTTVSHEQAQSLRLTASTTTSSVRAYSSTFDDAFQLYKTYRIGIWVYAAQTTTSIQLVAAYNNPVIGFPSNVSSTLKNPGSSKWYYLEVAMLSDGSAPTVSVYFYGSYTATTVGYIDEASCTLGADSVIDKRGFNRVHIMESEISTTTAAAALSSAFLEATNTPPFKGSLTTRGFLRTYATGMPVPVGMVQAGDRIMMLDEYDPTTGSYGRIGLISRVAYSHDDQEIQMDIDSDSEILSELASTRR